ncbi:MAG: hypothetical protein AAFX87_11815 [Bacteroidota bacterium]
MQLRIKPYAKSIHPIGGILIKGTEPYGWVKDIQSMGLTLSEIDVYGIPGKKANSVWGCVAVFKDNQCPKDIGRNAYCQMVENRLLIPEYAITYPKLSPLEIKEQFAEHRHILHPEFGLVELAEPINWNKLISLNEAQPLPHLLAPARSVKMPKLIKSFQVEEVTPEEALKHLEENVFPQQSALEDKPLSFLERIKLFFLKGLFRKQKDPDSSDDGSNVSKTTFMQKLDGLSQKLFGKSKWGEKLQQDFEQLEQRNQKQIDRLMDLFKNNLEEALKYAIPLDSTGSSRGGQESQLDLSKRWSDFSLFNNRGNASQEYSGSAVLPNEYYSQLNSKYNETARQLIDEGDYKKAAFIYMKLLKDYHRAATTLEQGHYYSEAASVYLKYAQNKTKAAECYEKGNMTNQAIDLYKDLDRHEKVGDLYLELNDEKEAHKYFGFVIDGFKKNKQYVKASMIYKNKIRDTSEAQSLLLEGWRTKADALNCLNNYFSNIDDIDLLHNQIEEIYRHETDDSNKEVFLKVIRHEYKRRDEVGDLTKHIAYEIISDRIKVNPSIADELKNFNEKDKVLSKDVLRFKQNARRGVGGIVQSLKNSSRTGKN